MQSNACIQMLRGTHPSLASSQTKSFRSTSARTVSEISPMTEKPFTSEAVLGPVETWAQIINEPSAWDVLQITCTKGRQHTNFPGYFSLIFRAKYRACSRSGCLVSNQSRSAYGAKVIVRLIAACVMGNESLYSYSRYLYQLTSTPPV